MTEPIEVPLATDIEGLRARLGGVQDTAEYHRALALQTRPDDVFIATFPKCGTTWVQQITHGLRTSGSMEFEEISRVAPWLERAHLFGIDPLAPQPAAPRLFKTHLDWGRVPKGARYIYVMRDPKDALVSLYHFFAGTLFDPEAIDLDLFGREFFVGEGWPEGTYTEHLRSWLKREGDEPVLLLCYEDLGHDHAQLEATVRRIAAFMDMPGDEARIDIATRQASFEFMREHKGKFTDQVPGTTLRFAKVRKGKVGGGRGELSEDVRDAIDDDWRKHIAGDLGFQDYGALRARVRESHGE